jgi:adenine-specific DNA-methyltransferase
MTEQIITKREEVRGLLRKLFRSDQADLDFGIYRIMNFKRKEIDDFIDHKLIEYAESEFKDFAKMSTTNLEGELEGDRKMIEGLLGLGVFNSEGDPVKYHDVKAVQEYEEKRKQLRSAAITEEQVNDVFSHVYEFFSRYYEDGDFIPKIRYGGRDKYYIPYNGEEVALHWVTKDMYYVKTGEYFKKYSFKAGRFTVTFHLVEAKVETGNVKGEKKFFILADEDPIYLDAENSLVEVRFNYRGLSEEEKKKHGTRNVQSTLITEALDKIRLNFVSGPIVSILRPRASEEHSLMEKHLNAYVDRNTKDFFIHKDLKGFLERELDFYLKNEVWNLNELDTFSQGSAKTISVKVETIRNIAQKIIEFINQIESFQKRLFEKKKFVLRTDYCITLDKIPEELYEEIGKNEKQVTEWKKLYSIDELTKNSFFNTNNKKILSTDFLKQYKYLVIDTSNFSTEFKDKLLGKMEDIENQIMGLYVKSENLQALNTMIDKYKEKIKIIYIDPPYNTGGDGFLYKDNYQTSSWITMMNDRLMLSKLYLKHDGCIFINIDDNEQSKLKILLDNIYGRTNFLASVSWEKRFTRNNNAKLFSSIKDFLMIYRCSEDLVYLREPRTEKSNDIYSNPDKDPRGDWTSVSYVNPASKEDRPNLFYPIINPVNGKEIIHPTNAWKYSIDEHKRHVLENRLYWGKFGENTYPRLKLFLTDTSGLVPVDIWKYEETGTTDEASIALENMFGKKVFDNPKPVRLIERICNLSLNQQRTNDDIIMDFFAGSGTTAQAIINLNRKGDNRKVIIIEMGQHFEEVLIPRVKKDVFSDEWKNGIPGKMNGISYFMKHQIFENYEDTLYNIDFKTPDAVIQKALDRFNDYFLSYVLDYETRESPTRLSIEKFKTPFDYRIKTLSAGEEREQPVDLVETFNYLLGLQIKKIRTHQDGDHLYRTVFGERDHEQVVVIWRDTPGLELERDRRFIENTILIGSTPDIIFVNDDSYVRNAKPIEPEFRRLMGA